MCITKTQSGLRSYYKLAIAGSAAYAMSTLFSAMKPILLTRFLEQAEVVESLAGLTVAMPFVGIASAAICMRGYLLRAPYKGIVLVFGSLLIGLELASSLVHDNLLVVLLAQYLCGISVGILMGTASRYIAMTNNPGQLFGFVDMMAVFLMSFMVYGVGVSVEFNGLTGGYLFAGIVSAIFTVMMLAYRSDSQVLVEDDNSTGEFIVGVRQLTTVLMSVLFVTCSGLGFAFMFSLARSLNMSYDTAGTNIGILLFLSAFACMAGGWASAKFGPVRPIAAACVTCALGWCAAIYAPNTELFLLALVPAVFSLQFNFPILLALCGSLDEYGRWASVATPLITSGFAWAAILAGQIVEFWGISALAPATAIGMSGCLLLLWVSRKT